MTLTSRPVPHPPQPPWFTALADQLAVAVIDRVRRGLAAQPPRQQPVQHRSPYATVEEAATFLRCKPQRIYDLLSARVLRRYKDGGRVLIKWSDLELHVTATERIQAGARRASGHA